MVVKYWNVILDKDSLPQDNEYEIFFVLHLPTELKIAHNKRLTFLGLIPSDNIANEFYMLTSDNIVFNDNVQNVDIIDGEKEATIDSELIGLAGFYEHPKTFYINDEIEDILLRIQTKNPVAIVTYALEMKVEYDF